MSGSTTEAEVDWYENFLRKLQKTSEETAELVKKVSQETSELVKKTSKETAEMLDKVVKEHYPRQDSSSSKPSLEEGTKPSLEESIKPSFDEGTKPGLDEEFEGSLAGKASKQMPGESGQKFSEIMQSYLKAVPSLKELLNGLEKNGNLKNFYLSDKAKDAFYDPGTKQIILPLKKLEAGNAIDVVDALTFEIFNAEVQEKYTDLHEEYMAGVKAGEGKPLSLQEYGDRKSKIEAEVTLKHAQSLFSLQEGKAELAYQGQRNLDKTAANIIRARLKKQKEETEETGKLKSALHYLEELLAVDPEVGQLKPPPRDKEQDTYIQGILRGVLPQLNSEENKSLKAELVEGIQNSIHNLKAKDDPCNMTALTTREVYAMEMLGTVKPKEWADFFMSEVKKAFQKLNTGKQPPNIDEIGDWVMKYIRTMDMEKDEYDYSRGCHQAILDVLDKLKAFYPEVSEGLGSSFDETFGTTESMKKMAKGRFEKQKENQSKNWEELLKKEEMFGNIFTMPPRTENNLTRPLVNACKASTLEESLVNLQSTIADAQDVSKYDKQTVKDIAEWLTTENITKMQKQWSLDKTALKEIDQWLETNKELEKSEIEEQKKEFEEKRKERSRLDDATKAEVGKLTQMRGELKNNLVKAFLFDNVQKPLKLRIEKM